MIEPTDIDNSFNDLNPNTKKFDQMDENPDRSLCLLLKVQAVFGITYCGNTPIGKKHTLKRIFMICYDLSLFVFFFVVNFYFFSDDSFDRTFGQMTTKRGVLNFIFRASGLVITVEYLVIKFMLMANGTELIKTITSIGII